MFKVRVAQNVEMLEVILILSSAILRITRKPLGATSASLHQAPSPSGFTIADADCPIPSTTMHLPCFVPVPVYRTLPYLTLYLTLSLYGRPRQANLLRFRHLNCISSLCLGCKSLQVEVLVALGPRTTGTSRCRYSCLALLWLFARSLVRNLPRNFPSSSFSQIIHLYVLGLIRSSAHLYLLVVEEDSWRCTEYLTSRRLVVVFGFFCPSAFLRNSSVAP